MTRTPVIGRALCAIICLASLSDADVLPGRRGAQGATCVPPADIGELAVLSDAVVMARAGHSAGEPRGLLIFTRTEFVVEESLSGPLDRGVRFTVETPGGQVGDRAWNVAGAPRFAAGSSYFLCLHRKAESLWTPAMLAYGVLEDVPADDGARLLSPLSDAAFASLLSRRDGMIPEAIVTYGRARFLASMSEVLSGQALWDGKSAVAEVAASTRRLKAPPPQCAFFSNRGRRLRWDTFDSGGSATIFGRRGGDASLPGGGFEEIVGALDLWMEIPGAGLNLTYGGEVDVALSCRSGDDSEPNVILFNDPCADIAQLSRCTGVLAFGGPLTEGAHRFDGATWETVVGWTVVVNDGVGCLGSSGFRSMIAHELGHGLGFAHVADEDALMFANCCNGINATDRVCAAFTYPAPDPGNERPVVSAGADRRLVLTGNTAFLSGEAVDDGLPPGSSIALDWTQVGGPGPVVFGDARALETPVIFPLPGTYTLRLTADDGELLGADYVRIEVETEVGSRISVAFQQGVNGYQGTFDTTLREGDPASDGSGERELAVDARESTSSDGQVQALLRFDAIFGAAPGQVPPGATIRSAALTLASTNFGDGATLRRMVEPWSDLAAWSDFENGGIAAGVEALDAVDAAADGSSGTVVVDVTSSVSAWSEDPCSNHGWALLPRGADGWRFHSAEGEIPPRLSIEFSPRSEETLIGAGETWTFFRGLEDPPSGWNGPDLELDDRWSEGATGIGYGDGDDTTLLGDMQDRYLTLYARREFRIDDPERLGRLVLRIDYDDGFIAYINGEEVARSRTLGPAGSPVDRNTQSGSREAGEAELHELSTAALTPGLNVLAVEVHNAAISSSDLSFDPRLQAISSPIEGGDAWSFRRGDRPIPGDWNQVDYDDTDWEVGHAPIGYGDGDDRTVLADMRGSYISVYARRVFVVSPAEQAAAFGLTVIYDDGVVLYLNGQELARAGMPAGEITPATGAIGGGDAQRLVVRIDRGLLRAGPNVLAASVHNATLDSSDLTFDAVLVSLRTGAREVDCGAPALVIRRGDVTDDASVNLADAVTLLSFLFESGAAPPCPDAADVDDDGGLSLSDAVTLLRFLFAGRDLAAPGDLCGADPTPDALAECASAGCDA